MITSWAIRRGLQRGLLPVLAVSIAVSSSEAAAQTSTVTRLFSGVASAGGANGTLWRSEVVLSNTRAVSTDVTLRIVPRNATNVVATKALTLAAGQTQRLPDLYAAMGASSGAGTLRVTGDVLVWVRTYNQGASGTFGMDVPGVTEDEGFAAGAPVLFPIQTPVNALREFRSNLLVTNLEATRVTLTLQAGAAVRTYDVEPGTFQQIDGVGAWLGAPNGPSMLTVVSTGRWFGLVTSIDPVLGDPTGIRGLTGETRATTVFPGVASASGMNGTLWRSEARIYNPGLTARTVGLEILPRGGSSVAASTVLSLGPLELRSLADVYAAVGAPTGAGTLRVTGDVVTWVRTFNKGPEATFGTDVPQVVPGVAFGAGARVAFPVHTAANVATGFRSNFLVFNHEAREITCTFKGAGVSATLAVPSGSFVQKDNLGAFLGLAPGTATVSVSANGRWSAIVTAIDPFLGDPTTVLGLLTTPNPVPTGEGIPDGAAATATIGTGGGSVSSPDGRLTLTVPAGALSGPVSFTVQPVTNLAWGGLGRAYRLTPERTVFAKPATLTFALTADDTSVVSTGGLGVGFQDADGYWHWVPGATRDLAAKRVSLPLSSLSPVPASAGWTAPPLASLGKAFVFRGDFTLLEGFVLRPESATVKANGIVPFTVSWCYMSSDEDVSAGGGSPGRWPGSTCAPYFLKERILPLWYVNAIFRGDARVGTVVMEDDIHAKYTAPDKAPTPDVVAVAAEVGDWYDLREVTVTSRVKVLGDDYRGTFTLRRSGLDKASYAVRGEAELETFLENENGVSYNMTGTLTIDGSFDWMGMTCTCADSVTKPIPADAVFAVQRKPSLAQRWVMPGVQWTFRCGPPPGSPIPFAIQYFVAPAGDCSVQSWVPLGDESHLAGSFTSACNLAVTINGSWDFQAE
ncbi:MAG: hypothetical protein IPN03_11535 [Holophagales bacterium]|nr:hypothetical protein [Holophagales bacterium]